MNQKFSEHLNLAHSLWSEILETGDTAIDATCGNGHDTCYLAKKILTKHVGLLYGYDIQKKAIENTYQKLQKESAYLDKIYLLQKNHIDFSDVQGNVKLIVYNLGYLPGSDKTVTTTEKTTLKSIENALLLKPKYISIMCYPGHLEGKMEAKAVTDYLSKLDDRKYSVCHYQWINKEDSPFLLFLKELI